MRARPSGGSSFSTRTSRRQTLTSRAFDANQRCSTTHSASASASMLRARSASVGIAILQEEPEEAPRGEGEQIRQLADAGEGGAPEHLDRRASLVVRQVELHGLGGPREVVHAQGDVVLEAADVGEDLVVRR